MSVRVFHLMQDFQRQGRDQVGIDRTLRPHEASAARFARAVAASCGPQPATSGDCI
jgi:hypothetical protein